MTFLNGHGRDSSSRFSLAGKGVGLLAMLAGLFGSGYLLVTSVIPYLFSEGGSLAVENAPIFLFWSVVVVALSLGVGYWAWTENVWRVWGLAVTVSIFSVLSLFSIGTVILPFAVLSLVTAVLLTVEHRAVTQQSTG